MGIGNAMEKLQAELREARRECADAGAADAEERLCFLRGLERALDIVKDECDGRWAT